MMKINPNIFREYDIRGVIGQDLTDESVRWLGLAFGTYLRRHGIEKATVGMDCRPSSKDFSKAIQAGLQETGIDTIAIGVVPTPLLYFSMFHLDVDGAVMVTGSHNPNEFNGFKLCAFKQALFGEQIREVQKIAQSATFASGQGKASSNDMVQPYMERVASDARMGRRRLKVVIDAGNGTGGVVAVPLYKKLGVDVVPLFCDMDGTFPNHHPDPTVPKNLDALRKKVVEVQADVGLAFDGDADRLGVVTEKGDIVFGDMILLVLSLALLQDEKGAKIVSEVKCSQVLFDEVARASGVPIMWKVGHSLIKAKMAEEGALLGGEMSGHIFFRHRWFGFDDAIYTGSRFLEVLSRTNEPLSQIVGRLPKKVSTPEIRVDCPDEIKFDVVSRLVSFFESEGFDVVAVDGARVKFEDGWGLVRASNTQPVLVFRFEAQNQEALTRIQDFMMSKAKDVQQEMQGEIRREA
jgi:phosphomannomutase/phosphoglucomutase